MVVSTLLYGREILTRCEYNKFRARAVGNRLSKSFFWYKKNSSGKERERVKFVGCEEPG